MCIGGLRLHVDHRQYHRRLSERRDTPHYHRSPLSTIVATSGLFNDPTLVFDITTIVFFIATVCPRIPSVTHSNIGIRSFKFSSYFHPSLVFQLPQGFGLGCSPIAPCCSVRNVYPSIWFVVLHHHVGVRFFLLILILILHFIILIESLNVSSFTRPVLLCNICYLASSTYTRDSKKHGTLCLLCFFISI